MLERCFARPKTVDRIRSSWLGAAIEQYVTWFLERGHAPRSLAERVPILLRFATFTHDRGARCYADLPPAVLPFVEHWITRPDHRRAPGSPRPRLAQEIRRPIEQMLRLVVPGFVGTRAAPCCPEPFIDRVPDFFAYLRDERGLRAATIWQYTHHLRQLAVYLRERGLCDLRALSPVVISGFLTDRGRHFSRIECQVSVPVVLRVCFLRYLHREGLVARDLSHTVDSPRVYRLATVPRSIEWGTRFGACWRPWISADAISLTFHRLVPQLGLVIPDGAVGPRVHDLRHYSGTRIIPSRLRVDGGSLVVSTC